MGDQDIGVLQIHLAAPENQELNMSSPSLGRADLPSDTRVTRSRNNVGGSSGLNKFPLSEAASTDSLRPTPSTSAATLIPTSRRPVGVTPSTSARIQFDSVTSKTYTKLERDCDK